MTAPLGRRSVVVATLMLVIGALILGSFEVVAAKSRASNRWNHVKPAGVTRPAANAEWNTAGATGTMNLTFHEPFGPDFTFVDVGKKGDTPGDYGVFRDELADPGTGEVVGTIDVQCIAAYADQCRGSLRINGRGQITFDGITPLGQDPDYFAVTGGTKEYVGVGGVFQVSFPSDEYALLTLRLTK
jgi:hypothetical protein